MTMPERKRLLGIVASHRVGGNSEALVRVALGAAADVGAETDIVHLSDLRVGFCRGCLRCVYKGQGCVQDDDVPWLFETAAAYDGLILAAPTYLLGAAAQVKALIDRAVADLVRRPGRRSKPTGTLCVAGLPGWDHFVRPVTNQLALLLGGRLVGSLTAYAPGPGEVLLDEGVLQRARDIGLAVLEDRLLPPPEGACPVCHLQRPPEALRTPCQFCGHDPAGPEGSHRFTGESLARFVEEWMHPSRERFLARRREIEAARAALQEFRPRRVRPG